MDKEPKRKYSVQLSFEEIHLPPFDDILILGKKIPQGKHGVLKSFEFLLPNEFEVIEIDDEMVEPIFIYKKVFKKMDKEDIIKILKDKVFPFMSEREVLKVNFKLKFFDYSE